MKKLLYFLLATIVFFSCKKSDNSASTDTYLPSTVGTNWTYKITTGSGTAATSTTVKYTVSNTDTTALGKTYRVINGNNGTNQYYNKTNSDYFTFRSLAGQGVELNFLKDNVAVNQGWNTSQTLNGLTGLPGGITSATMNIAYIVKEKGTTKTVSGRTYSDVIKVEATLSATALILNLPLGTAEFYFAKNVGIIENKVQVSNTTLGFNIDEKYELQSYEIK
jgi:hypothetical protein